MARAKTPVTPAPAPKRHLSLDEMKRGIERLQERIGELNKFDINLVRTKGNPPELMTLETSIERTLSKIFGEGTSDYKRFLPGSDVTASFSVYYDGYPAMTDYIEQIEKKNTRAKQFLMEAIRALEEEISDQAKAVPETKPTPSRSKRKVFIVHGHDEAALQSLARFLEKLGLDATVLKELPDQGQTIIEKFERSSSDVGFAIVLLTPDDVGSAMKAAKQSQRARQNVLFELGYFVGVLGRGHVCLLRKDKVEIPSDLYGVIYTDMDAADAWKTKLVMEMKAAELDFDANRLWGN